MKVSSQKSAIIPFTKKRLEGLKVKVRGEQIELVNTHAYLGYVLDKGLTHRKHIEAVKEKAGAKIGLLKMLSRKSSGANPETLVKIGNALIRSRMEYGATVYGNAVKTNLNKLQVLQNAYIRKAMHYLGSTPIHVMLAEAGQLPMKQGIENLTKRELIRTIWYRTPLMKFVGDTMDKAIGNK